MSDEPDPRRLLDEGGGEGELRSLLRAGKSEVPNEAQMLALAAKIGVLGGLGGAGAAGAGGGGAAAKVGAGAGATIKAGLALKVIGAVALAGVAGGGAVMAVRHASETAVAPVGIVASPTSPTSPTSPAASPTATASATASAASAASATASAASTTTTSTSRVVGSLETEVKLLQLAQDALRARPEEALALCADHAKRFPTGMLVQEREVIAVEALIKAGRKDEARIRADRFKARFPGSSHTRRLETLLAN